MKLSKILTLLFAIFFFQNCMSQHNLSITKDKETSKTTNVDINTEARTFKYIQSM